MRVLVTGSEGYIGTILAPYLLRRGYDVVGLDTGFHRAGWLYNGVDRAPAWINADVRRLGVDDLRGFDALVHLAEISNDPVGEIDPAVTFEVNHAGSVRLAKLAKDAEVERFVYMSSCSVYGAAGTVLSTEDSELRPLTAYARSKAMVERDVRTLADDDFSPTFLRNATAYGASPRIRFDLVVNELAGRAWCERVIRLHSDGSAWRPFVHILDISAAIERTLAAPRDAIHNEVFNVGSNAQNHRVAEIAGIVAAALPDCKLILGPDADRRDYRVDFTRISERLPGFRCRYDVETGVRQLLDVFGRIELDAATFGFRGYSRLKQIKHLLATKQIDEHLFWLDLPAPTAAD